MSNSRYFNRVGYVRIVDINGHVLDGNEEFYGLNFKFSCEITSPPSEGRKAMASVGILGLSGEKVYLWSSYCNSSTPENYVAPGRDTEYARRRTKFIEVYAGYESQASRGRYLQGRATDGMGSSDSEGKLELKLPKPLFVLPIAGAWPTMPPDMWLNISAYTTEQVNGAWYEFSLPRRPDGVTFLRFRQICSAFADVIGAKLRWNVHEKLEKKLPVFANGWSSYGTISTITQELYEAAEHELKIYVGYEYPDIGTPILFVEHNTVLIGYTKEDYEDEDKLFTPFEEIKSRTERAKGVDATRSELLKNRGPVISVENGMIGLPKVVYGDGGAGQIEVTTLLRNDIEPDDRFTVKSSIIRNANDTFIATKVKHVGELRGSQWQTTITGIRVRQRTGRVRRR